MRAAFYEKTGAPRDVLQIGALADPHAGSGEVRVRLHVSGINPSDTKKRAGWGGLAHMEHPLIVPHNDGAGVIDEVGAGVDKSRLGERVWVYEAQRDGRALGTAAEFVVVPTTLAVTLPDATSMEAGASLGVPAMTAHRCLFQDGSVHGKVVLVAGGTGSVGMLAVQLAKWSGAARVLATVGSQAQESIARSAGADTIFRYNDKDLATRIHDALGREHGVDRIIEVAFGSNIMLDARVIAQGGTIASYASGDVAGDAPSVPFLALASMNAKLEFVFVYNIPAQAKRDAANDITAALAQGALAPRVAARYTLEQIADAHEALGTGGAGGKAVLTVI